MYLCLPGRHTLEQLCEVLVGWERHFLFHAGQSSVRAFVRSFVRSFVEVGKRRETKRRETNTDRKVRIWSESCLRVYVCSYFDQCICCLYLSLSNAHVTRHVWCEGDADDLHPRSFLPSSLPPYLEISNVTSVLDDGGAKRVEMVFALVFASDSAQC